MTCQKGSRTMDYQDTLYARVFGAPLENSSFLLSMDYPTILQKATVLQLS